MGDKTWEKGIFAAMEKQAVHQQIEECPPACCPNTGELAPNFGFEGDFIAVGADLIPAGWTGTNVTQETVQANIHSGEKAVVLGRSTATDATLSTTITSGIQGGCFYFFAFYMGGTGPSVFEGEVVFIDSGGMESSGGIIRVIGASKVAGVGSFYRIITTMAPEDLAAIRIDFRKLGVGSSTLDDVSLTIA